jgi:hypothetical protein
MKNEEVNRKSFFTLRDNFIDLTIQVEKEIIRIMRENDLVELELGHRILHLVKDGVIGKLNSIKIVNECGLDLLHFRWDNDNEFYSSEDNINWIELLYEVLESIEYGVLD